MAIPDFQSLLLPVLRHASDGEVKIGDIVERIAQEFDLSEDERSELLPSGKQTVIANRTHWAKTYLAKAGLVKQTRRAHFAITPDGEKVLAKNLQKLDVKFLRHYPAFVEFHSGGQKESGEAHHANQSSDGDRTPDEVMRAAYRQIEEALKAELIDRIGKAPPTFFERLLVILLTEMGYGGAAVAPGRVLGGSSDGGVDGVIDQDALGLDRVYIQAKRYNPGNNIGASTIREFFGSLDRFKAAKGILVTTSDFTKEAVETASYTSKRIVLVNGDRLAALMIRYNVGCRIEETLHVKKVDEDFFLE
jgi:restriction system protein